MRPRMDAFRRTVVATGVPNAFGSRKIPKWHIARIQRATKSRGCADVPTSHCKSFSRRPAIGQLSKSVVWIVRCGFGTRCQCLSWIALGNLFRPAITRCFRGRRRRLFRLNKA
jgi:hypothetical protein